MVNLSRKQLDALAQMVAEKLHAMQDEMWDVDKLTSELGLSKSYVYHNTGILGGVKAFGKWFFSKRNVEALIKSGTN